MEGSRTKNIILTAVVAVLLIGAVLAFFQDSLFGGSAKEMPAANTEAAAKVGESVGITNDKPAPDVPMANPPPRGSGKKPMGMH